MNHALTLAAALVLTSSAAHAAILDLGKVQLSHADAAFTSQALTDVDADYLTQARPGGYSGPSVSPTQRYTPTVSAENTIALSPSFDWSFYAPELYGYLTDDRIPGFGTATLSAKNLLLEAHSGWAIKSITWTVEGHMTQGYQASVSVQGGDIAVSAPLLGGSQLTNAYTETPVAPSSALSANRTFIHQTSLTLSQAQQQFTLDEVRFQFGATGYTRVECRDPVLFEQISCNSMESPWYHADYGMVSATVTSARLSIEVTAVPEPSSMVLGLVASGWLLGRRRLNPIG